jgi:hypothetical protein
VDGNPAWQTTRPAQGFSQTRKRVFVRQPLPTVQKLDPEFLKNSDVGLIVHSRIRRYWIHRNPTALNQIRSYGQLRWSSVRSLSLDYQRHVSWLGFRIETLAEVLDNLLLKAFAAESPTISSYQMLDTRSQAVETQHPRSIS